MEEKCLINLSLQVPPKQGPGRARKPGHDGDENVEEEDVSTADQPMVEHIEQDPLHTAEVPHGHIVSILESFLMSSRTHFNPTLYENGYIN